MAKIFHLELKQDGIHKFYGSLAALCRHNNNIGISKFTLDRYNFEIPYENEVCLIRKSVIIKSQRKMS